MRVVLLELAAARPDHLGCHGYPRPTFASLDDLGAASTIFTLCHLDVLPRPPLFPALAGPLGRSGYATTSLSADEAVAWLGVHRAQDRWLLHVPIPAQGGAAFLTQVRSQPAYIAGAVMPTQAEYDAFAATAGLPALTYAELLTRIDQYDATLAAQDAVVARILAALDQVRDQTVLVITASSALALAETRPTIAADSGAEGASHVPLIVRVPGLTDAGWFYDGLLYQHDIVATLLEVLGLPGPPGGMSHLPALKGEPMHARTHLVIRHPAGRAVRTNDHRVIQTGAHVALYDLRADPLQWHDLAPTNPALVRSLSSLT